jgi:hypothetical protein
MDLACRLFTLSLTAWGMMNTEVHWISDYPLALALGYVVAESPLCAIERFQRKARNI